MHEHCQTSHIKAQGGRDLASRTTRRSRGRRGSGEVTRDELELTLDVIANSIRLIGDRKLLPLYERVERELAAMDNNDAVMRRALERARMSNPKIDNGAASGSSISRQKARKTRN